MAGERGADLAHTGVGLRAREVGLAPGVFPPGPLNAITDVAGVKVGHQTLIQGDAIRTGVTVLLPHSDNLHRLRPPAGFYACNGHGKFFGAAQVLELGEIESPIALTNTLSVPEVASGLIDWTLNYPGNEAVRSVNVVVGETNDSLVNDIRARVIRPADLFAALAAATDGPVTEGSVGAGAGTQAFAWKGGMGTSSRVLPVELGGFRVGVLVQTNYGGTPMLGGRPVLDLTDGYDRGDALDRMDGSVIIVVATDAPLLARDLCRLAKRPFFGLARTGSSMAHSSGEFAVAFSTEPDVRRDRDAVSPRILVASLSDLTFSALFQATVEATEEAVYNAMFAATPIESRIGRLLPIPLATVKKTLSGLPDAGSGRPRWTL